MRTAGKTGVAVGTLVWATPLVQTTVPAWAAEGSGAHDPHNGGGSPDPHSEPLSDSNNAGGAGGGGGAGTPSGDTSVLAAEDTRRTSGSGGGSVIAPGGFDLAGVGELARTGADPWNLVKLAGGAIAVGGVARAVGRQLEQQDDATELGLDGGCVEA
jgi:hypothetical protein